MPEVDDEVWCGVDPKGEDGCILGSKYNDKDAPPFDGNDDIGLTFPGGSVHVDRASGAITIRSSGTVRITASKIVLDGEVHLGGDGGQLVHRKGDARQCRRHRHRQRRQGLRRVSCHQGLFRLAFRLVLLGLTFN